MWRIDQFFPENENRMLHAPINLFYRMDWMASISTIPKALLIYKQCIAMVWRIIPWVICFFWSNMGMIFWDLAFYFISHFAFYWTPMVNIFWWTSYGEHFMVNILWWTFYGEHLMVNWTSCGNIKTALWAALSLRNYFHRALWDTCHSWDMWSEWWGDRLWPSKIQKQWQRQLQKQVQCNGTVIPDKEISFKGTCKHRDTITLTLTLKNNNVKSDTGQSILAMF